MEKPSLAWEPAMAKRLMWQAQVTEITRRSALAHPHWVRSLRDFLQETEFLRRNALALILRHRSHFEAAALLEIVRANWDHSDRLIRKATANLIATLGEAERRALAGQAKTPVQQITCCLGGAPPEPSQILARAAAILAGTSTAPATRRDAVRILQLALGDLTARRVQEPVWEGYSPRRSPLWTQAVEERLPPAGNRCPAHLDRDSFSRAVRALRRAFPSGNADLDREISRTLAVLEDDDPPTLAKVAARLSSASDPVEDVHYLIVLARLRGARPTEVTRRTAAALLALDAKLARRRLNRDHHWPLRIAEVHAELARKDPGLNHALLSDPTFGRPGHVLLTRAPGFDWKKAAAIFLRLTEKDADYEWNPELVQLLGLLPAERVLPALRRQWDNGGLQEAILAVLARQPQAPDRDRFLLGLTWPHPATVRSCVDALEKLPPGKDAGQTLLLIQALRRLGDSKEDRLLASRLAGLLNRVTGQAQLGVNGRAWLEWFGKKYPALATRLTNPDGVDVAGWQRR
jgi:hypothetical protein